ncbi:MAG: hypothetical protein V7739_21210 [Motiliproteus sp.]
MNIITMPMADHNNIDNHLAPLTSKRKQKAKCSYSCRRADLDHASQILTGNLRPQSGDLVLARITRLGQHKRLELNTGRRAHLHLGDEIIVSYGARYAPDQFEAYVPEHFDECDLVAAGGIAAESASRNGSMKPATRITPIGLLADHQGKRINLSRFSLAAPVGSFSRPKVYGVLGTSMNSGKTTCSGMLIHGFGEQGLSVGAAKVTGTGAGCDAWVYTDAGADKVLDFTDMGVPSTFGLCLAQLESIMLGLIHNLSQAGVEVIVMEVADGLLQQETSALVNSACFRRICDGVIFAAPDAMGAIGGVNQLRSQGINVLAVGGLLTTAPLAIKEAQAMLDIPVVTAQQMETAAWLPDPQEVASMDNVRDIDLAY